MKIFKVLLVVAIALGMMACNNEQDVPEIIDGPEATVSVRVVPTSNGPSVRLAGDITSPLAAESVIKTLEVFIFSGGMPDGYGIATGDDVTQVIGIETHSGPKTFYVVANANIGQVASEVDLLAKTKELPVVIDKGLPMTSDRKEVVLDAGENQYGFTSESDNYKESANNLSETPVALVRVNARVAIVSAALSNNLPVDQQAIFDNLTDIEVAMFNVPKASKLFGDSLAINKNFLFGEAWPTTQNTYTVGVENDNFKTDLSFPILNTDAPYFYVTENTSTEDNQRMFIVLRGKPTKGGDPVVAEGLYTDGEGYTYYPIWVNANDKEYNYGNGYVATNVISRNTQYNISLTINGIGNPTIDEVEEAFLDVNVSVAPWAVVTQNVEW
jgi:hypothetical protein